MTPVIPTPPATAPAARHSVPFRAIVAWLLPILSFLVLLSPFHPYRAGPPSGHHAIQETARVLALLYLSVLSALVVAAWSFVREPRHRSLTRALMWVYALFLAYWLRPLLQDFFG